MGKYGIWKNGIITRDGVLLEWKFLCYCKIHPTCLGNLDFENNFLIPPITCYNHTGMCTLWCNNEWVWDMIILTVLLSFLSAFTSIHTTWRVSSFTTFCYYFFSLHCSKVVFTRPRPKKFIKRSKKVYKRSKRQINIASHLWYFFTTWTLSYCPNLLGIILKNLSFITWQKYELLLSK